MALTPADRIMRAQLGAHSQWARCEDRTERTAAARSGLRKRFENQVDPGGVLDPAERAVRAEHAFKAHMLRLAMASAKARRAKSLKSRIDTDEGGAE